MPAVVSLLICLLVLANPAEAARRKRRVAPAPVKRALNAPRTQTPLMLRSPGTSEDRLKGAAIRSEDLHDAPAQPAAPKKKPQDALSNDPLEIVFRGITEAFEDAVAMIRRK